MFSSSVSRPALTLEPWICSRCQTLVRSGIYSGPRAFSRVSNEERNPAKPYRKTTQKLPDTPARTRFAPSPTGYMHLGSLRTALFNYLLAKATGGQFLLRIEDTDQRRTVPDAQERICRDLEWAGLQWDEGPEVGGPFEPYRQSERTALYQEHSRQLLDSGHAYRCFCTPERLHQLAEARSKLGLPTDYDRTCAGIARAESDDRAHKCEPYTIRLKVPDKQPQYTDLIYGTVGKSTEKGKKFKYGEAIYEDPILIKSDGLPTYHLANVVDDHHMKITHVIRAVEWMPSTPKHLSLYNAFGWTPPSFAHVGLLMDKQGRKLSKRNLDTDISSFRDRGILPEALVNHVALLGWSHSQDNDFHTLEQLVQNFDLKFTKGNTVVSFEKLNFLQRRHAEIAIEAKSLSWEKIVSNILEELGRRSGWTILNPDFTARDYIAAILEGDKQNYTTPSAFLDRNIHFFCNYTWPSDVSPFATLEGDYNRDDIFSTTQNMFNSDVLKDWNVVTINRQLYDIARSIQPSHYEYEKSKTEGPVAVKGILLKWLRIAVMKGANGPPMADTIYVLGKVASQRILEAQKASERENKQDS